MTTPTLTVFAEGRLCTAGPFDRHGAGRRETPVSPPQGGGGMLETARRIPL